MAQSRYIFERFALDPAERQLWLDAVPVELNARYLDALILLLREQGALVTKERFLEEVWRGIPVTDEALTQCIKTLRRQLGDSAASPRFIETVPKHGYRFIAPVEWVDALPAASVVQEAPVSSNQPAPKPVPSWSWQQFLMLGGAGTTGGGVAGLIGGLFFGFVGAAQPQQSGMGAISVLLVMISITTLIGVLGAAGVSFGIAVAEFAPARPWLRNVVGGACGGLVVGAIVKLLGMDAFQLLFGQAPGDITGAFEGLLLGAAAGFGLWFGSRSASPDLLRHSMLSGAIAGGVVGMLLPLMGGRLMGGSLALLAESFPESRLHLDLLGGLFGEVRFGIITQVMTAGLEGAVFIACVVGAMVLARRQYTELWQLDE
jgi:DNA-binding winged helix-turn-helix (wHTH) protein